MSVNLKETMNRTKRLFSDYELPVHLGRSGECDIVLLELGEIGNLLFT